MLFPNGKMYLNSFRNLVRDEETAKLCEELKAMRELHEQQEQVIFSFLKLFLSMCTFSR